MKYCNCPCCGNYKDAIEGMVIVVNGIRFLVCFDCAESMSKKQIRRKIVKRFRR